MLILKQDFFNAVNLQTLPLNNGCRLWDHRVRYSLREYSDHIHLESLQAIPPFANHGERFMQMFARQADIYQIPIKLQVAPGHGISRDRLTQWYEKFGFEQDSGYAMLRQPQ